MTFKDGIYLTLLVLLAGVLVFRELTRPVCPTIIATTTKTDTFYTKKDTVKISSVSVKYKDTGHIKYVSSVEYIDRQQNIDSIKNYYALLYEEYNAVRPIQDSLYDGPNYVKLYDTVSQNLIQGRKYKFHTEPVYITKTVTNTLSSPPKTEFYFGGQVSGNKEYPFYGINGIFLVKNKNNSIFGISAGSDVYKKLNLGITYAVHL